MAVCFVNLRLAMSLTDESLHCRQAARAAACLERNLAASPWDRRQRRAFAFCHDACSKCLTRDRSPGVAYPSSYALRPAAHPRVKAYLEPASRFARSLLRKTARRFEVCLDPGTR